MHSVRIRISMLQCVHYYWYAHVYVLTYCTNCTNMTFCNVLMKEHHFLYWMGVSSCTDVCTCLDILYPVGDLILLLAFVDSLQYPGRNFSSVHSTLHTHAHWGVQFFCIFALLYSSRSVQFLFLDFHNCAYLLMFRDYRKCKDFSDKLPGQSFRF